MGVGFACSAQVVVKVVEHLQTAVYLPLGILTVLGVRRGATLGSASSSLLENTRTCFAENRSNTFFASSQLR